MGDLYVRESPVLIAAPTPRIQSREVNTAAQLAFAFDNLQELTDEPLVDFRARGEFVNRDPPPERFVQREEPLWGWHHTSLPERVQLQCGKLRVLAQGEADATLFERANRLLQRLGKVTSNRHDLTDGLHARAELGRR